MPYADRSLIANPDRLAALRKLCLLDTAVDPAFDRITSLASRILNVPVSLVSLVDEDRQFFKRQIGLPEPYNQTRETPLSHSFCQHVVALTQPLIVTDAREHPLVHDNPAVADLNIIAYAGIPLMTSGGASVGSFCAIDTVPREWTDEEIGLLTDLAALVMTEVELHVELREHEKDNHRLMESERFARKIVNAIPAIMLIHDGAAGKITFLNGECEAILGYTPAELESLPVGDLANLVDTGPDPEGKQQLLQHLMQSCVGETQIEVYHKDGSKRWLHLRSSEFTRHEDGSPAQTLVIAYDVTHSKVAEQQALVLKLEREQVRLLQEFIDTTSHDLRTPLTLMQTSMYIIKRQYEHGQALDMARLDMVEDQVNHLIMILDDLEMMSELDKINSLEYELVDINSLTRGVVDYVQDTHQLADSYRVLLDLPPQPVLIPISIGQIQIALHSIIENAFIHTESDIAIRLYENADETLIEVQDSGPGIEQADLANIFKRLYKTNKARTQNDSGSGLGLAMVKRIMELHQGRVEVESGVGEGSTFRLVLPKNRLNPN